MCRGVWSTVRLTNHEVVTGTRLQLQNTEHEKRGLNVFFTVRTDRLLCMSCKTLYTFEPKIDHPIKQPSVMNSTVLN